MHRRRLPGRPRCAIVALGCAIAGQAPGALCAAEAESMQVAQAATPSPMTPARDAVDGATLPEVTVKSGGVPAAADDFITQAGAATVGKSPVAVQDTPFSVGVVDAARIRDTGARNIQDALVYSSGVYAGRYGFDTRGDMAAVRGLAPSFYIDGLRSLYGFYNNVRPELYTLERIEVLKGPSSVLYGQAELGGIVNAVSKLPRRTSARQVELQVGAHDRKQVAADLTGPLGADNTWLYRVVALARESGTQVDFVNDDALVFMPSLTWQASPDTRLTLLHLQQKNDSKVSAQFLPSKGTIAPAPLGQVPSNRFVGEPAWDRYDTRKRETSLMLEHHLAASWTLAGILRKTGSASVTREHWTTVGAVPDDAGNITRSIHTADRRTDVFAADVRLAGRVSLGPTRHELAIGVDHQNALWEEYNYSSAATSGGIINLYNPVYGQVNTAALTWSDRPDNRIVQTGVYLIDHMAWGPWIVSLALRHDRARNTQLNVGTAPNVTADTAATTGRAGLMYRFANGVSPYVGISEAFTPNLGTDGTPAAGVLKPTTGRQNEAGVKYLSASGNTAVNVALFDIEQRNRVANGLTPGGFEQVGAKISGWELEVRQRIGGLEVLGNYTSMSAINDATGKRLGSVAEKVASAWAQYRAPSGWRVGLGGRYIGSVTGNAGAPVLPSVSLLDAMIGYTIGAWDFRLDIRNLADKQYLSWCRGLNLDCGYGDRRLAALTARYAF